MEQKKKNRKVIVAERKFQLVCLSLALLSVSCKKDNTAINLVYTDGKTGMLEAVNALRSKGCYCGVDSMPPAPQLRWNDTLAHAATAHAQDMFFKSYFSHISPDGSVPIQRAEAEGYSGSSVLENIGQGYYSLNDVIAAWEKSLDHCKSMMNPDYKELGAARANGYWVQEFGRP